MQRKFANRILYVINLIKSGRNFHKSFKTTGVIFRTLLSIVSLVVILVRNNKSGDRLALLQLYIGAGWRIGLYRSILWCIRGYLSILRFPKSHMYECSFLKARRAGDSFSRQNVPSKKFYITQLATVISFSASANDLDIILWSFQKISIGYSSMRQVLHLRKWEVLWKVCFRAILVSWRGEWYAVFELLLYEYHAIEVA